MSEFSLKPRSAFAPGEAPIAHAGPYSLADVTDLALASVSVRRDGAEALARLEAHLGVKLPDAGCLSEAGPHTVFWMGEGQWMVTAPHETHEMLAQDLKAIAGEAVSVTEQNDAWACLELTGPAIEEVFARLTSLDLEAAASGSAFRTSIEHIGCFVLCLEKGARYRILMGRSFARSMHHAVLQTLHATVAIAERP